MEVDINEHYKTSGDFSRVKTYHINLYDSQPEAFQEEKSRGLLPERRYNDTEYINEYIDVMKGYGFFACYNHPYWSLQNYDVGRTFGASGAWKFIITAASRKACTAIIPKAMMKCSALETAFTAFRQTITTIPIPLDTHSAIPLEALP